MNKKTLISSAIGALALSLAIAQTTQKPATPQAPSKTAPQAQNQAQQPMARMGFWAVQTVANFLGLTPPELALLSQGTDSLGALARSLGKDAARLEAILVEARNKSLDQAVTDGVLTAEQATQYRASSAAFIKLVMAQDFDLPMGRGGRGEMGMGHGDGPHGGMGKGRGPGR